MRTWSDVGIDESRLNGAYGNVKMPCPKCGPTRKHPNDPSLSVDIAEKVWKCHNCDWSGTLKGRDHVQQSRTYQQREWKRPDEARYASQVDTALPPSVVEYFKRRGIPHQVLIDNEIGFGLAKPWSYLDRDGKTWCDRKDPSGGLSRAIFFPYRMDGTLVNVKSRLWESGTAQKDFRLTKGAQKILWQIDRAEETTIICEGEVDLLAYNAAGIHNVVSVPNGASVSEYLEACAPQLARVQRFILSVDGDEAGLALRDELARRLGKENCLYVTYPEGTKDANEVLLKYGVEGIQKLVAGARYFPVEGLVEIAELAEEIDYYYEHGLPGGYSTGLKSVDRLFRLAPGSFYIFTGRPGHGKSSFIAQILLNAAKLHDWSIAIFSAEDSPTSAWIVKSLQRLTGKPFTPDDPHRMTPEEKASGMRFLQEHFVPIVPNEATFSIDEILRLARIAVFRRGIKVLLIDPWNEVDFSVPRGMDRQDYISQVLTKMRIFGRQHDVAVLLVAHPRKSAASAKKEGEETKESVPDLDDVSGSGHFRAKADIGVVVHRDIMNVSGRQIFKVINMKTRQPWHGMLGAVELEFDKATGLITDPEGEVTELADLTEINQVLGEDW